MCVHRSRSAPSSSGSGRLRKLASHAPLPPPLPPHPINDTATHNNSHIGNNNRPPPLTPGPYPTLSGTPSNGLHDTPTSTGSGTAGSGSRPFSRPRELMLNNSRHLNTSTSEASEDTSHKRHLSPTLHSPKSLDNTRISDHYYTSHIPHNYDPYDSYAYEPDSDTNNRSDDSCDGNENAAVRRKMGDSHDTSTSSIHNSSGIHNTNNNSSNLILLSSSTKQLTLNIK